ncbi:hypothetical protein BH09MYX1_BH09MYX1_53670 [soil metagenome]
MNGDQVLFISVVVAFAAWATVHVLLAGAFFLSARKKLALLAFCVPFAAPIVALRNRERTLGVLWIGVGVAYVALLLIART